MELLGEQIVGLISLLIFNLTHSYQDTKRDPKVEDSSEQVENSKFSKVKKWQDLGQQVLQITR